ncbi:hypothetical protein OHA04_27780 [Streptomyces sp. NBC_01590]|uniref:hypothetical protein n=1 Tax=Streptomyces sp. NBC_01590 TaxID=2975887 RepID=UPI003863DF46
MPELWTIEQAAEYFGIQPGSARGLLSRRKVRRITTGEHPTSGRIVALFSADEVRAIGSDRRPGRRTDLR